MKEILEKKIEKTRAELEVNRVALKNMRQSYEEAVRVIQIKTLRLEGEIKAYYFILDYIKGEE